MLISKLKLITFDVTGTLLKFRTSPGQQYGDIGALFGAVCDEKTLSTNFKTRWRHMNKVHPNFGLHSLGWENWWKDIVEYTFKDCKCKGKDLCLDMVAEHLINVYKTSTCWQHCYGCQNLLSYIRSKSIPMGIISNFDPRLNQLLINVKLRHYFKFVITSYDIGVEKPHEKIFREAMFVSKLNNLKPNECLHIGDKLSLDYYGARNSGWQGVIIDERKIDEIKKENPDVNEDNFFTSLYELHKHFIQTSQDKLCSQKL